MEKIITWLENHQMPCFYKQSLGIDCPGCGMQSAFLLLLRGRVLESIQTYPALLPIMFMLTYLTMHLVFDFKKGAFVLKISFIFTVIIIVISYIFKIVNF
ncbi:MAG: DUF2752 domain-containing protein [Bacteroidales bacterium]|nr:DUF2752 domain-containing protein [Bacteroidales bacterium]